MEAKKLTSMNFLIGRRTGKDPRVGKVIRKFDDGLENFSDYWSESDASAFEVTVHDKISGAKENTTPPFKIDSPKKSMSPFSAGPSNSVKKNPKPSKSQEGIDGNGDTSGSITKNSTVANNSALQSFQTRKRLTYTQLERLSNGQPKEIECDANTTLTNGKQEEHEEHVTESVITVNSDGQQQEATDHRQIQSEEINSEGSSKVLETVKKLKSDAHPAKEDAPGTKSKNNVKTSAKHLAEDNDKIEPVESGDETGPRRSKRTSRTMFTLTTNKKPAHGKHAKRSSVVEFPAKVTVTADVHPPWEKIHEQVEGVPVKVTHEKCDDTEQSKINKIIVEKNNCSDDMFNTNQAEMKSVSNSPQKLDSNCQEQNTGQDINDTLTNIENVQEIAEGAMDNNAIDENHTEDGTKSTADHIASNIAQTYHDNTADISPIKSMFIALQRTRHQSNYIITENSSDSDDGGGDFQFTEDEAEVLKTNRTKSRKVHLNRKNIKVGESSSESMNEKSAKVMKKGKDKEKKRRQMKTVDVKKKNVDKSPVDTKCISDQMEEVPVVLAEDHPTANSNQLSSDEKNMKFMKKKRNDGKQNNLKRKKKKNIKMIPINISTQLEEIARTSITIHNSRDEPSTRDYSLKQSRVKDKAPPNEGKGKTLAKPKKTKSREKHTVDDGTQYIRDDELCNEEVANDDNLQSTSPEHGSYSSKGNYKENTTTDTHITPPNGIRKSSRTKFSPVEWFKNERIVGGCLISENSQENANDGDKAKQTHSRKRSSSGSSNKGSSNVDNDEYTCSEAFYESTHVPGAKPQKRNSTVLAHQETLPNNHDILENDSSDNMKSKTSPAKRRKTVSPVIPEKKEKRKKHRKKSVMLNSIMNASPCRHQPPSVGSATVPRSILKKRRNLSGRTTPSQNTPLSDGDSPVHFYEMTNMSTTPFIPTKTNAKSVKIIVPRPAEDGTRKSKRTRVKPVQWYKNEQVKYDRRKSGGFAITGVIPAPFEDDFMKQWFPKKQTKKAPPAKRPNRKLRSLSMHTDLPDAYDVVDSSDILVVNPNTDEEVLVDCVQRKKSFNFRGPTGKHPEPDDSLLLCKCIQQKAFSAGEIVIRPLQEKPTQFVRSDTMVFHILHGKMAVTIHTTTSILESGDMFFVPQGNVYSIKNLRDEDARLCFYQHKG